MTVMTVVPRDPSEWAVGDLDHLPDDGLQYELLDGVLLVSPAPTVLHQVVTRAVFKAIDAACPAGLLTLFAPLDWRPDPRTSVQPDVLVIRNQNLDVKHVTEVLTLAVEVLSPATRGKDLVWKRSKYEDAGVPSYWVVDPAVPSIVAWDLNDGRYQLAGEATGSQKCELRRPFPRTLIPSDLIVP